MYNPAYVYTELGCTRMGSTRDFSADQIAMEYVFYRMAHHKAMSAGVLSKDFEIHNLKGMELHEQADKPYQLQKAREQFLKALEAAGTNAYAKSAIQHNLGILYNAHYGLLPGGVVENLDRAKSYLDKALRCEERKRFPDRYAYTLTQLAVTWRKAAQEHLWPDAPEVCYQKAEKLNHQALESVRENCPLPAALAAQAQVLMNLSSVLLDQDKNEEACAATFEAYCCYMKACNLISPAPLLTEMDMPHLLTLTFSRLHHLGNGLEHYQRVCDEILKLAPEYGVAEEQLYFTAPNVDGNSLETEVIRLIMAIKQDPTPKNIRTAKEKAVQLYDKRQSAQTDQAADDIARHIQMLTSGVARGFASHEMLLEAFVELENVSAMRFIESQSANWFIPEKKLPLALYQVQRQLGALYYAMNEAVLYYRIHDSNADRDLFFKKANEGFDQFYESTAELEGTGICFDSSVYLKVFKEAAESDDPEMVLGSSSRTVLNDFKKIEQKLIALYPQYNQHRYDISSIRQVHIEKALKEYPDLVLIKIDHETGHDDLLLIASYLDKGNILTKSHTITAPSQVSNTIVDTVVSFQTSETEEWDLSFINWKSILPHGKNQVAILPSYHAAHIPWAATGCHGKRLLDLVDEVLWLPSILSLCHKPKHFRNRKSTVRLSGGGTLFEKHAHTDQVLYKPDRNNDKDDFLEKMATADVLSFYGHAEHKHPDRPKLLFQDFALYDLQVGSEVCGMARVELWACQSGSNIPQQFMGSPVNEAFGMDMKMLEFGVETAIGTLWAVPELVTSHIKRYYDTLVASGVKASKALILAQRWWINDGADQQLELIKKIGTKQYLVSLGYSGENKLTTSALMGPVLASKANDDLETLSYNFKHPSAWAGLRFCGVPEHRCIHIPAEQVRFTEQDKVELKKILDELHVSSEYV